MNKDNLVQLWLDAEEQSRKHTSEGINNCLELKDRFFKEYEKLSIEDKEDIQEELDSYGA